jgi:hypothetical protein
MRKAASFLRPFLLFAVLGCASTPPPDATNPGEPTTAATAPGEPAPPAPPPPAEPAAPPSAPPPVPSGPDSPPAAEETAKAPAGPQTGGKAAPTGAGSSYSGSDACKLAIKGNSPVAQACREGGAKKAKDTMKALVKRAKDNGTKFRCDDCHKDPQDFTKLARDARDRFAKLLAAAK